MLRISKLTTDNNLTVEFSGDVCYVKDTLRGQVLLQGLAEKGLYKLLLKSSAQTLLFSFLCQIISKPLSMLSVCHSSFNCQLNVQSKVSDNKICYYIIVNSYNSAMDKILLLHKRFGHPNFHTLMHLFKQVKSINISHSVKQQALKIICEECQMGKSHRLHFPATETKTTKILELIHTDLWGPSPHPSKEGYSYYISFVDDFSKYTWIFPLKLKSAALEVFKLFKLQVEKQFDTSIKMLQSD